jgi:hypothetical protein
VAAISCNRLSPRQIVLTPGSPSLFRPKKPPSKAIIRTASRKDGGVFGGSGVWEIVAHNDCHSCVSKTVSYHVR